MRNKEVEIQDFILKGVHISLFLIPTSYFLIPYFTFLISLRGLTGFDSIALCKYKHVLRCVISSLIRIRKL